MNAVEVSNLIKHYGSFTAVDNISFSVKKGGFFGFLGPNGAGKTTTINSIVGLGKFDMGDIKVMGHDVRKDYRITRKLIGLAPQEFNFDRYLSIFDILVYQAGYFGIKRAECKEKAEELLRQFGLWEKRKRDVMKLSGGMKRRLMLARAMIHNPQMLVLDEPTAGVDVELRLELWDFLKKENRKGLTIFLTTHYLEEAEKLCKTVGIINNGKLIAMDDTHSLIKKMSGESVEITFKKPPKKIPRSLLSHDFKRSGNSLEFYNMDPNNIHGLLLAFRRAGISIESVRTKRRSLQDIFVDMVKK